MLQVLEPQSRRNLIAYISTSVIEALLAERPHDERSVRSIIHAHLSAQNQDSGRSLTDRWAVNDLSSPAVLAEMRTIALMPRQLLPTDVGAHTHTNSHECMLGARTHLQHIHVHSRTCTHACV